MEIDPISKMTVDEKTAKFTSGYCVFFSVISIRERKKAGRGAGTSTAKLCEACDAGGD